MSAALVLLFLLLLADVGGAPSFPGGGDVQVVEEMQRVPFHSAVDVVVAAADDGAAIGGGDAERPYGRSAVALLQGAGDAAAEDALPSSEWRPETAALQKAAVLTADGDAAAAGGEDELQRRHGRAPVAAGRHCLPRNEQPSD